PPTGSGYPSTSGVDIPIPTSSASSVGHGYGSYARTYRLVAYRPTADEPTGAAAAVAPRERTSWRGNSRPDPIGAIPGAGPSPAADKREPQRHRELPRRQNRSVPEPVARRLRLRRSGRGSVWTGASRT